MRQFNRILIVIGLLWFGFSVQAQQSCYQNPSLEGPSQPHVVPALWQACYGSPDTHPGQWGFTQPPSNWNSYLDALYGVYRSNREG